MNLANFLGLNGGGARTELELYMLIYLYDLLGEDLFTYFDIIGGTSGGALITALLSVKTNPKEIAEIYERELPNIFKSKCFREILGKSKYGNTYLKGLATELIGNIKLGDLKQKILIPTVNTSKQETKIFKSYDTDDMDYKLVDVIIASSSAPRYFPAHDIKIQEIINWFKDGGLSSNNPSDILAIEGMNNKRFNFSQVNILSLTSGENKDVVTKAEIKGNLLSIPEMIDEILNLQDKKTHGNVTKFYDYGVLNGIYTRCEAQIDKSSGLIDDVSKKNIEAMKYDAQQSLIYNKQKIDNFIKITKNKRK